MPSTIIDIGADPNKVIVTGNTKYDQTYGIVTEEEKKRFLHELGFSGRQSHHDCRQYPPAAKTVRYIRPL